MFFFITTYLARLTQQVYDTLRNNVLPMSFLGIFLRNNIGTIVCL